MTKGHPNTKERDTKRGLNSYGISLRVNSLSIRGLKLWAKSALLLFAHELRVLKTTYVIALASVDSGE